ncbi:tetratricopeptide repeat protein [uncultured Clostridium sp.]|uniref:tetratricopeptide repeat protein n=1 Tax=uncultured Clostridium sp. TaxID=59620 RepID=UPI0025EB2C93|nr:tetratricopeptide repeat protein [uncultured Clostridium sp.]
MEDKLEISDILLKYNKLDMALEVLEEVRENFPNSKEVLFRISKVYEKKGFYDQALDILHKVKLLEPKNGETYFKMATIYQMKEDLGKCYENLSLALNNGFSSEKVFYYKGLVKESLVKFNEAIYEYTKALRKNNGYLEARYRKYSVYMKLNMIEEAKVTLDEMIKYNGYVYDGYNLRIILALKENNNKEAYKFLQKAQSIFNDYSPLKLDFVKYYIQEKQYKEALNIIDTISDEDGYYEDFMIIKSRILCLQENNEEAIELLNDYKVYNEENLEMIFLLSLLNYKVGNVTESIKNIEIINNSDELTSEYSKLALILKGYVYKYNKEFDKAIEHFKNVYNIFRIQNLSDPYNTSTLFLRILTLIEANEFDKCQVLINGLERLEPVKFNSEVKDLRELISIKKNKNSQDITDEKEILINIFSKR